MDPFAIVVLTVLAVGALCVWVAARGNRRGTVAAPPGVRPTGQIVAEREALEEQDLRQLLDATNARRRARGLPERTADQAEAELGGGPLRPGL